MLDNEWYWEVWTLNGPGGEDADGGREWKTRYVCQHVDGKHYLSGFEAACIGLGRKLKSKELDDLERALRVSQHKNELLLRTATLLVASLTFLLTICTFLYMMAAQGVTGDKIVISVLSGVIASGAALFFGKWIPFK